MVSLTTRFTWLGALHTLGLHRVGNFHVQPLCQINPCGDVLVETLSPPLRFMIPLSFGSWEQSRKRNDPGLTSFSTAA